MSSPKPVKRSSASRLSRLLCSQESSPGEAISDSEGFNVEDSQYVGLRPRAQSSSVAASFSSMNQRTPARSYYQRSFHGSFAPSAPPHNASQDVREHTAELASWALSDAVSVRIDSTHARTHGQATTITTNSLDTFFDEHQNQEHLHAHDSLESSHPEVIHEASEPSSPESRPSSGPSPGASTLSELIRNSQPTEEESGGIDATSDFDGRVIHAVTVGNGIISQPHERTALLSNKGRAGLEYLSSIHQLRDAENGMIKNAGHKGAIRKLLMLPEVHGCGIIRVIVNPKSWNIRSVWREGIIQPASYAPAVAIGLLLNILDSLSYGLILFPLSEGVFSNLGPDGISMFYVSCIISQLVYSCGGSRFKGGVGSEMIEVVPFFHSMALTVLSEVGEDNPESVIATTIICYALSTILTGVVFFLLGKFKLGSLVGFFPRHILMGCIGGVGFFLVVTGVEVSARLQGNLEYNFATLKLLFQPETILLWLIPLALALILLKLVPELCTWPQKDAIFFLLIIAAFYGFVVGTAKQKLENLRHDGWVFESPKVGVPFYHFYTLYDFTIVNWYGVASTIPAQLALTFFGILHVPINIPALGQSIEEDDLDIDRELKAHGLSNALSGCCGSIQNYLVYSNSVIFIRSGGDSRVAGVFLALATAVVFVGGPGLIGFVPVTVVGALIFYLGMTLMDDALVKPWARTSRLEYLTIVIIIVTMGGWDFVTGIIVGIVLACVSFVVQTSRIPAIRTVLHGGVASSTVRRHPIQNRFLQEVGKQTLVLKLDGYLFFGTIVDVEKRIRVLLDDAYQSQPIRFLVLDLSKVDGVDYSAAEVFTLVSRISSRLDIRMIICGTSMDQPVGKSLRNVGLFEEDAVSFFEDLNSALEECENELLTTFYRHKDAFLEAHTNAGLEVPRQVSSSFSDGIMMNSPRQRQLHNVAINALQEQHDTSSHTEWQRYKQPLQLLLQAFSSVSDRGEEFWYRVTPSLVRQEFSAGDVLYHRGDVPDGFYLLESGMLKAEYVFDQGRFAEVIVAGTTCGELPFFSGTTRTSTTTAEKKCIAWMLSSRKWEDLRSNEPDISQELYKISLKLTKERMDAITKYMLTTGG